MAKRQSGTAGISSSETTTRENFAGIKSNDQDAELPAGWAMALGGDLFDLIRGVTYNKGDASQLAGAGKVAVLRAGNIQGGRLNRDDLVFVPEDCVSSAQRLLAGDLVIAMSSGSKTVVGKVAVAESSDRSTSFGAFCGVIRPKSDVSARWLYWLFQTPDYRKYISEKSAGVNINNLRPSHLQGLRIALPPVAEQRRIVTRFETLEARSRQARGELNALIPLLAQARQAILAASVRGDLTAGWRERRSESDTGSELLAKLQQTHRESRANSRANAAQATEGAHDLSADVLPDSWAVAALQDVCRPTKPICYGILMPGPDRPDGVPYIRVADFPTDFICTETVRKTTAEIDAQFARARLSGGDLLLSIRGTVGRVAVVPSELNGANITQDSARLSIHELVGADFVAAMLRAPDTQQRMQRAVKGVAVRGINIGDVRPLQIPLPPLAEQHEIVRRLNAAFARLDAAIAAHAAAVAELDRLDASLLAKAFRGELVPQDPADEPAAVTLQRLRTPRELFDPFAYLFQFIPALIRASEGALPFARALEGCALLRVPRDLVRLLEPIGGAPARQHFERFAQPLNDGSFEPVLRKLIDAGAITHEPRANHRLRLVESKAPPIAPLIAEDARHVASVLALVPAEALEDLTPRHTRKLCPKPAAAMLAG